MTTPKMPLSALVPAYRIQLPTRMRTEAVMKTTLGPPLFNMYITTLERLLLNQLIVASDTLKYSADVLEIDEKVNH
ncbi:hypothetical protein TMatcc_000270 [Talaromyces marneffei ATCC 18224]